MQGTPRFLRQFFVILVSGILTFSIPVFAWDGGDNPFHPSENLTADVDAVLARAIENEKLALIVMGASWCHDSMGLYSHFQDPDLAATLEANYELIFVDVGYLEFGREVIQRFGQPVIYGTPTVLIIDPKTEQLLNGESMHRYRDSANIEIDEARAYFANSANPAKKVLVQAPVSPQLQNLFDQIDAFEQEQATRIYRGFAVLRPLMEADEERGDRHENYIDYWHQLAILRYTITEDLAKLRHEVSSRVAAGEEDVNLEFPEYPAFSWE